MLSENQEDAEASVKAGYGFLVMSQRHLLLVCSVFSPLLWLARNYRICGDARLLKREPPSFVQDFHFTILSASAIVSLAPQCLCVEALRLACLRSLPPRSRCFDHGLASWILCVQEISLSRRCSCIHQRNKVTARLHNIALWICHLVWCVFMNLNHIKVGIALRFSLSKKLRIRSFDLSTNPI
jgi:hypothetical protein